MAYASKYYHLMAGGGFSFGGLFKSVAKIAAPILSRLAPVARIVPGLGTAIGVASLAKTGVSALKGLAPIRGVAAPSTWKALTPTFAGGARGLGLGGAAALGAGAGALGGATIPGAIRGGGGAAQAFQDVVRGGGMAGGRRRYRRMNPMNQRAARRAIRRIKAVRKITRDIERTLPKRAAPARSPFRRKR